MGPEAKPASNSSTNLKWQELTSVQVQALTISIKAQIKCFTAFRRFQPACTPFSCGHIWYQTLWKEACTFPHASSLQLLTDGAWHGTGAPPLIRSALSISCREIEFEFEIITDCSICWCKCDGRSDYLLLFEIFYAVGGERGKVANGPPPPRRSLADKRGDLHTALISSYEGLVSELCFTRTGEREERDIHTRIGRVFSRIFFAEITDFHYAA